MLKQIEIILSVDCIINGANPSAITDKTTLISNFKSLNDTFNLDFLDNKPDGLEIVLTGRNACKEVIERAHLVSEIKPIKHYWDLGVSARKGIEY